MFVTVGHHNQPFDRLLLMVRNAMAQGHVAVPVVVQRGCSRLEFPGAIVFDYLPVSEFQRLMDQATVVVTQAGLGAVLGAIKRGVRPVLVARRRDHAEAVDDHQVEFASVLAKEGIARVAHDDESFQQQLVQAQAEGRSQRVSYSNDRILGLLDHFLERVVT